MNDGQSALSETTRGDGLETCSTPCTRACGPDDVDGRRCACDGPSSSDDNTGMETLENVLLDDRSADSVVDGVCGPALDELPSLICRLGILTAVRWVVR